MKLTSVFILILSGWVSFTAQRPSLRWLTDLAKQPLPDITRFTAMQLVQGLNEPMGMGILPNNNVLIVERKGAVRLYDATAKQLKTIANINVFSGIEDGLLGVAIDPNFEQNHWIYLYYGVGGEKWVSQLVRMELQGDQLVQSSKKVLLEIPTQRKYCCHSAGYLTFSNGLLYLSTGDNTNAEEIEGHNPTDERPGRELSDDQAATANSNDLRGKILRIKPKPDGTYSIPDGNLFPKDGSSGRPEIYVMGCRNPFRVSVDPKTNFVYWGDVGPDTQVPAEEGTLSYDEINQARKPGFFGYPYFLGNNEAFPKYNFATKKEGPKQDPTHPVNNSPHNTGIRTLPPAQPAMIWYGKLASKRFPLVGKGGASAMAGPVYYQDQFAHTRYRLPEYYNGKLLIYDWIRRWMMAVTLDRNGNYASMEPFLSHLKFVAPMDMQFNRDGSLYILAYGTNWFASNTDAGLIRVEYAEGNRNPVADIRVDNYYGAAPMRIRLSASGSNDYDPGDRLTYTWHIGGKRFLDKDVSTTFAKPGVYPIALTVTDQQGGQGLANTTIYVGNTPPQLQISTNANRSFYWDKSMVDYRIQINDAEDKPIDPARATISFNYLDYGKDLASVLSGGHAATAYLAGEKAIAASDCKACHSLDKASIGPSFNAIATRYKGKSAAVDPLAQKIIKGGSGAWGKYAMSAHPALAMQEAQNMVRYILSLSSQPIQLPMTGAVALDKHTGKGTEGAYVLLASYTDKGAHGIEPLTSRTYIALRNPLIQMEDNDRSNVGVVIATASTGFISYIRKIYHNSFVVFNQLDLNQVSYINYRALAQGIGGQIELHLDSLQGPLVGSVSIPAEQVPDLKTGWKDVLAPIKPTKGLHDLYFVFTNETGPHKELFYLDWMHIEKNSK